MKNLILVFLLVLLFPLLIFGCGVEEKTFITIEADPDKGFHWAYYLFIPSMSVPENQGVYLLVSSSNTTGNDDLQVHDDGAYYDVSRGWKSKVARKLCVPLLVPVFPRPYSQWWIYTHALNRNTLMVDKGDLTRIDLQLIAMIRDAQEQLRDMGLNMEEKILMNGFSACGTFSNRFAVLHPEIVKAVASGGVGSIPIFPTAEWEGEKLTYPVGIADIEEIAGITFDYDEYVKVAQYIYMGALDDNDATYYDDSFSRQHANQIWRLIGKEMDVRWEKSEQIYKELGIPAQFVTYEGIGHEITEEIIEDIVDFFEESIND